MRMDCCACACAHHSSAAAHRCQGGWHRSVLDRPGRWLAGGAPASCHTPAHAWPCQAAVKAPALPHFTHTCPQAVDTDSTMQRVAQLVAAGIRKQRAHALASALGLPSARGAAALTQANPVALPSSCSCAPKARVASKSTSHVQLALVDVWKSCHVACHLVSARSDAHLNAQDGVRWGSPVRTRIAPPVHVKTEGALETSLHAYAHVCRLAYRRVIRMPASKQTIRASTIGTVSLDADQAYNAYQREVRGTAWPSFQTLWQSPQRSSGRCSESATALVQRPLAQPHARSGLASEQCTVTATCTNAQSVRASAQQLSMRLGSAPVSAARLCMQRRTEAACRPVCRDGQPTRTTSSGQRRTRQRAMVLQA